MVSKKKSTKKAQPAGAAKKSRRSDQPVGTTIARISNAQISRAEGAKASKTPRVKAVLFVPEGQDPKNLDLNIQVVSVSPMGLGIISARRC